MCVCNNASYTLKLCLLKQMCAVHIHTAKKKEHTWMCEFERRNKEQKGSDAIHQKIAFSCDITCMNACGDAFRFRTAHDSDDDDGFPLSLSLSIFCSYTHRFIIIQSCQTPDTTAKHCKPKALYLI